VQEWEKKNCEHKYLEDVEGEEALRWVREKNAESVQKLGDPNKSELFDKVLSILDSKDKIPFVAKIGDYYYNLWQDAQNQKGIFRRTTLLSFKSKDTKWETVLDIDALAAAEKENWVWKGYTLYEPDDETIPPTKALFKLSRGGADATVVREFDLSTKEFVSNCAFILPEAKSRVAWKDENVLLVGTNFETIDGQADDSTRNGGNSLTESGYPRTVREWKRGTSLQDAKEVFAGDAKDVAVSAYVSKHRNFKVEFRHRALTFFTAKYSVKINDMEWQDLNVPADAQVSQFADQMIVTLRSAWELGDKNYPAGSLLAIGWIDFVNNKAKAKIVSLFKPEERISMDYYASTKNFLLVHTMENVRSRLHFWRYDKSCTWNYEGAEKEAAIRGGSVSPVDGNANDFYWLTTSTFTKPSTLALADAKLGPSGVSQAKTHKSLPPQYNSTNLVETQGEAISKDGTRIPYFMIASKDLVNDGDNPTLLYSYGGFQISLPPFYLGSVGKGWLESGGVYILANIRGGGMLVPFSLVVLLFKKISLLRIKKLFFLLVIQFHFHTGEFGPSWHQAALKENRNKAYEDFIAVAEDLISKRVTSPRRLGIRGGSNGGLLVGNAMVMRPDLWGAVCCAVPLLDMKIFNRLLAGASWMAE